ncbi:MAG TPA: sigma factor-like helix-turn-helix DNA-binding protein [Acidimicrobiia bacterium]
MTDQAATDTFTEFVITHERRLRQALSAALGSEIGAEAAAEALAHAWEYWPRIREMDNPIGYLYVVGRNRGRRMFRRNPVRLMPVDVSIHEPWVEPALPGALETLPDQQRICVMLVHCFDWTLAEVAGLLGITKSTVQTYVERALSRLRRRLGVEDS